MPPVSRRINAAIFAVSMLFEAGAANPAELEHIAWMLGCWAEKSAAPSATERWTIDGEMMTGIGEATRDGTVIVVEQMNIRKDEDGNLVFTASPVGQTTTSFVMTNIADDEIVFENRDHDFPQRIIYRLLPDFDLLGRIEGVIDGQARSADFPMRKVECWST